MTQFLERNHEDQIREARLKLISILHKYQSEVDLRADIYSKRRTKIQVYFDILLSIKKLNKSKTMNLTRIRGMSNTSHNSMLKHLGEMESRGLILKTPLSITEKGEKFLEKYAFVKAQTDQINTEFL